MPRVVIVQDQKVDPNEPMHTDDGEGKNFILDKPYPIEKL